MEHNLLVAARTEYTEQLQDILSNTIYTAINDLWKECGEDKKLKCFQEKLCTIPIWNQEIINKHYRSSLSNEISSEYLEKIIEAVFLSNVKILSVVKLRNKKQSIEVNVPETKNFIHKCFIDCAREFYMDPYLIDDRKDLVDKQLNYKRSLKLIRDCIEKTIRSMIPMEDILDKYLMANGSESDPDSDFEPSPPSPQQSPPPSPQQSPPPSPQQSPQMPQLFESEHDELFMKPEETTPEETNTPIEVNAPTETLNVKVPYSHNDVKEDVQEKRNENFFDSD